MRAQILEDGERGNAYYGRSNPAVRATKQPPGGRPERIRARAPELGRRRMLPTESRVLELTSSAGLPVVWSWSHTWRRCADSVHRVSPSTRGRPVWRAAGRSSSRTRSPARGSTRTAEPARARTSESSRPYKYTCALQFDAPETQSVANHRHRAERHGRARDHRTEIESALTTEVVSVTIRASAKRNPSAIEKRRRRSLTAFAIAHRRAAICSSRRSTMKRWRRTRQHG